MQQNYVFNFDSIVANEEVQTYLKFADYAYAKLGYSDHGVKHALRCANTAEYILKELGYEEKYQHLAKVAAYLHDIGNIISTTEHDQSGAVMFLNLVREKYYNDDVYTIANAIGSHEDKKMNPISCVSAALIIADKTDVTSDRLRTADMTKIDKYSRVIAACKDKELKVDKDKMIISLHLTIDTSICSVMDYFEIFLDRTNFCKRATMFLKCEFELFINKDRFL